MYFKTQYTPDTRIGSKQAFSGPSMTEPDNAMSIPEIIARFTRGAGIQVQQHPWTVSDVDAEDRQYFKNLDPADTAVNPPTQPDPKPAPEPAPPVTPPAPPQPDPNPAPEPPKPAPAS